MNEPQNHNPSGYPGMDMPVAQQAKLIAALGPKLRDAGLETKILGYDHNWSTHPNDAVATWSGDGFDLDLGRTQGVRRVVLDTGADTSAAPQGYTLSTSTDGTHWQEAASGTGTGQLTTIDIAATQARYLRVALRAPAMIADVRLYR